MIKRLKEYIFQDVKNENETKRVSVILRLNAIIMCLYFLCLLVILCSAGYYRSLILLIPCLVAYIVSFSTTYMNKTMLAAIFANALMVIWIIAFIWEYGWDCGAQHFIFVLVVLCFCIYRLAPKYKVIMAVLACALRLGLYFYKTYADPKIVLNVETIFIFQIVNTIFIFILLAAILLIFSQDTLELEEKLMSYNEQLHHQASVDPLTGLWNRRSMQDYLNQEINAYRKSNISNLSIAIGDIDFFKKVNDRYGHDGGDEVLRQVSDLLARNIESKGRVCRWGGEEFLLVFHDMNGDDAMALLMDIRTHLKRLAIPYEDQVIQVTMTFGLSEYDVKNGMDFTINEADEKLYQGKESGRDKIVF